MNDTTRAILDHAASAGYTIKVEWAVAPTRKTYSFKARGIGVGWIDNGEFEAAMLFDPWEEDAELVRILHSHGVVVEYDGEVIEPDEVKDG